MGAASLSGVNRERFFTHLNVLGLIIFTWQIILGFVLSKTILAWFFDSGSAGFSHFSPC